jgi:transposase-like protein
LSSLPNCGKPARGLVVIAAEADGQSIGRIRMRTIQNESVDSLHTFVEDCIAPASSLLTGDGHGYTGLEQKGYQHEVHASAGPLVTDSDCAYGWGDDGDVDTDLESDETRMHGRPDYSFTSLPRVEQVAAALKRWVLCTHQGAVKQAHLAYYLDEFTFRFNARKCRSRGRLFQRLVQQAVATGPISYGALVSRRRRSRKASAKPHPTFAARALPEAPKSVIPGSAGPFKADSR